MAPTRDLEQKIVEEIRAKGPMTVARFMDLALYHPALGYYSRGPERSSRKGHYLTSPEIGPAYGTLWCRAFEEIWSAAGSPAEFTLAEVGPGEGAFIAAVLAASKGAFRDALRVHLIERVPALRRRQEKVLGELPLGAGRHEVSWHAQLAEVPRRAAGCVFANEVLDNVPVHVILGTPDGPAEVCIVEHGGTLSEEAGPLSGEVLDSVEQMPPLSPGARFEIRPGVRSILEAAASTFERGAVITVDYGNEATDLAARPGGTLICYSHAGTDDAYLADVGDKDITAHVDWTALRRDLSSVALDPDGPRPQIDVLRLLGARALEQQHRKDHDQAVAEGDGAGAFRALAARQSIATLTDPGGLGALGVMVGTKGLPRRIFGAEAGESG